MSTIKKIVLCGIGIAAVTLVGLAISSRSRGKPDKINNTYKIRG